MTLWDELNEKIGWYEHEVERINKIDRPTDKERGMRKVYAEVVCDLETLLEEKIEKVK